MISVFMDKLQYERDRAMRGFCGDRIIDIFFNRSGLQYNLRVKVV